MFCGPGTRLDKRLARGDKGINQLDSACKEHDIAYSQNRDNIEVRNAADRVLADKAWERVKARDANLGEKAAVLAVAGVMKAKSKLGMGVKNKVKKKRTRKIPIAKRGGFILPALTGVATAATVIKTIKDMINSKKMVKETERHNRVMEDLAKQGKGLYLKPYKKYGGGTKKGKGSKKGKNTKKNFL